MRPLALFDYDGVLVDSLEYFLDAFLDSCLEHGCHQVRSRDDFLALFDINFYDGMAKAGLSGSLRHAVFHGMAERLKAKSEKYSLFPGIPEALRGLAEFADIYVISSNDSDVVQKFLDAHNLSVYREVLGGDKDTSKVRKIRTVSGRHPGVPAIYVGDTSGDILEAREAAAIAVGAGWGWHGRDRLTKVRPDHLLNAPADLVPCLRAIISTLPFAGPAL
jgi:phosphoglycolate phosphatase